jgi:hypothetical protein
MSDEELNERIAVVNDVKRFGVNSMYNAVTKLKENPLEMIHIFEKHIDNYWCLQHNESHRVQSPVFKNNLREYLSIVWRICMSLREDLTDKYNENVNEVKKDSLLKTASKIHKILEENYYDPLSNHCYKYPDGLLYDFTYNEMDYDPTDGAVEYEQPNRRIAVGHGGNIFDAVISTSDNELKQYLKKYKKISNQFKTWQDKFLFWKETIEPHLNEIMKTNIRIYVIFASKLDRDLPDDEEDENYIDTDDIILEAKDKKVKNMVIFLIQNMITELKVEYIGTIYYNLMKQSKNQDALKKEMFAYLKEKKLFDDHFMPWQILAMYTKLNMNDRVAIARKNRESLRRLKRD